MNSLRNLFCLLLSVALIACTSVAPIKGNDAKTMSAQVHPGDTVVVHLKNGRNIQMTVQQLDGKTLSGDTATVAWNEVQSIERAQFSAGKTTALVLGTVAVAWVALVAVFRNGMKEFSSGN